MRRDSIFSIHFLIVRGSCNQVRICKTTTPNARIRASILECCSLVFGDVFEVMMALAQSGLAENRRRRFFQAPGLGTHQQRIWSAGHLRTSKDDHDPDADAPTAKMKYMYALSSRRTAARAISTDFCDRDTACSPLEMVPRAPRTHEPGTATDNCATAIRRNCSRSLRESRSPSRPAMWSSRVCAENCGKSG